MSTTNLEEAASIASEFVSSLDNLPAEVQHLLAEMKQRDVKSQELHQEIQKEGAKYVRHSLRSAPNQALSAKDLAIPAMIQSHYAEIDRLGQEKERLAQRVFQLVFRARARLDSDLSRVLVLQGEPDMPAAQVGYHPSVAPKNPVTQVNESLRSVASVAELPTTPTSSGGGPPMKRRRVTAAASAGSIKLPSPAPATVPVAAHAAVGAASQRSRLSQQVQLRNSPAARGRRVATSVGPDADEDAEGEEDMEDDAMEEGGDTEDKELYCFCRKLSYGEMIACDNSDCRYQWFHLPCVNLKPPLPDQWYCDDCIGRFGSALSGGPERRKGRKK